MTAAVILLVAGAVMVLWIWRRHSAGSRLRRIQQYVFPASIAGKVRESYPHLTEAQAAMVMKGLREYFFISLAANGRMVSMPSKAVDTAWHEFILFTRAYQQFCEAAFGRFLHHTPAEAMRMPTQAQEGIKRAWRLACRREGIHPSTPRKLPLLFAVDQVLSIPDGYRYALNCQAGLTGEEYCAAHIGCGGGCGGGSSDHGCSGHGCSGDSGSGDGGSSGGDGGGCGGGD